MRVPTLTAFLLTLSLCLFADTPFRGSWRLEPRVAVDEEWQRLYLDQDRLSGGIQRIDFQSENQAILYWREERYSSTYQATPRRDGSIALSFHSPDNMVHWYLTVTPYNGEQLFVYSIDQSNGLSGLIRRQPFYCEFIGVMKPAD